MSSMIENGCELTAIISAIRRVTFLCSGLSYFQGSLCSLTSFNVSWRVSEIFLCLTTCSSFLFASSCCLNSSSSNFSECARHKWLHRKFFTILTTATYGFLISSTYCCCFIARIDGKIVPNITSFSR